MSIRGCLPINADGIGNMAFYLASNHVTSHHESQVMVQPTPCGVDLEFEASPKAQMLLPRLLGRRGPRSLVGRHSHSHATFVPCG